MKREAVSLLPQQPPQKSFLRRATFADLLTITTIFQPKTFLAALTYTDIFAHGLFCGSPTSKLYKVTEALDCIFDFYSGDSEKSQEHEAVMEEEVLEDKDNTDKLVSNSQ